jgi:PRC-barrel domain
MTSRLGVHRLKELRGTPVVAAAGEPLGRVQEIFYEPSTNRPVWLGVRLLAPAGGGVRLVPLENAAIGDEGLMVPYTIERVRRAPEVPEHVGGLHDRDLRTYYGLSSPERPASSSPLLRWTDERAAAVAAHDARAAWNA